RSLNPRSSIAMSQLSTGLSRQEKRALPVARPSLSVTPLAVPPREAGRLLSLGIWRIYKLMRSGELQSYSDGRARRIPMASINDYIARRLAANAGEWRQIRPRPSQHRRGGA